MGFFDERKHKLIAKELWTEMVRVNSALTDASHAIQEAASTEIVVKMAKLVPELANLTSEGKFSLGGIISKRGISLLDRDIVNGASTWVVGASLMTSNMLQSSGQSMVHHEVHSMLKRALASEEVRNTGNSTKVESTPPCSLTEADSERTKSLDTVDLCLSKTLEFAYNRAISSLARFEREFRLLPAEKIWRVQCCAFGILDYLSQIKGLNESEAFVTAAAFFRMRLFLSEDNALKVVNKLTRLEKGMPGYNFITHGGMAAMEFGRSGDIKAFQKVGGYIAQ